jgi:predicted lysophospholipase L1 biosynthesis ABC-type transport system permease subunit
MRTKSGSKTITRDPNWLGPPIPPGEILLEEYLKPLGRSRGPRRRPVLLGTVSANVATLIFARTAMREAEMVVRHALGASRARVIAQIVTERLVLALAAAVLGLVVAQTTVRYAVARATLISGESLPFWVDLKLEPATIAYALLLALVAATLIGLLPAKD